MANNNIQYFSKLPLIFYSFNNNNSNSPTIAINILARARFRRLVLAYSVAFYDYYVDEGATPDILAENVYGSSYYHYIILLANDIINPYTDWVMPSNTFIRYLQKKYNMEDISPLQRRNWTLDELTLNGNEYSIPVHSFYTKKGRQIDQLTYRYQFVNYPTDNKPYYKTFFEYEDELNEAKRKIKLIKKEYVPIINQQMNDLMNDALFG